MRIHGDLHVFDCTGSEEVMKPRSIKKLPPHLRPLSKFQSVFRYMTPDATEKIYPNDPRYESANFDEVIAIKWDSPFPPPFYSKMEDKDVPKAVRNL